MRFGVRLPNSGPFAIPSVVLEVARKAERLGYDLLTAHDHIPWGESQKYHFSAGTVEALDKTDSKLNFYESSTVLAYVAAATTRIKLLPAAFVLPLRHPLVLAKQVATLNQLSGGRLIFCASIGNVEKDFEVLGVPWKKRGKITDEYLLALKTVFSKKATSSFTGKFVDFKDASFYPKPDGLPFWIASGISDQALNRLARFGDGWLPATSAENISIGLRKLEPLMKERGRNMEELEIYNESFLCLASSEDEATSISSKTLDTFSTLKETRRTHPGDFGTANLIGSPKTVARRMKDFEVTGVEGFELKFLASSSESMLEMMELFMKEVAPTFQ